MHADPSLRDEELQAEIDLVGALVIAASQTDERLTDELIDEILGVSTGEPPLAPADLPGRD